MKAREFKKRGEFTVPNGEVEIFGKTILKVGDKVWRKRILPITGKVGWGLWMTIEGYAGKRCDYIGNSSTHRFTTPK